MTELKCPYCNKQLQHAVSIDTHDFYWCPNYDCDSSSEMVGTEETWATIIDTKKKLDVAKKWLTKIGYLNMSEHGLGSEEMMTTWCKTVALRGLAEIEIGPEQKEEK